MKKIKKLAAIVFITCLTILLLSVMLEWGNSAFFAFSKGEDIVRNAEICFYGRMWNIGEGAVKYAQSCQNTFMDSAINLTRLPIIFSVITLAISNTVERNKEKIKDQVKLRKEKAGTQIDKFQSESIRRLEEAKIYVTSNISEIKENPRTKEITKEMQNIQKKSSASIKDWYKRIKLSTIYIRDKGQNEPFDRTRISSFSNSEDYAVLTIITIGCPALLVLSIYIFGYNIFPLFSIGVFAIW